MTDIEWGAEIAVNGKRPEWIVDGDRCLVSTKYSADNWYDETEPNMGWGVILSIRLPAVHDYYKATSRGFTYWQGGESAPEDWDGGSVLLRGGQAVTPSKHFQWDWREPSHWNISGDIIGYRKRTEQPAIAPELVERMVALMAYMAAGAESILEQYHPVNTGLGMAYTEAKAINDALRPEDPDLTLAKSIVGDAEAIALAIKAARENGK